MLNIQSIAEHVGAPVIKNQKLIEDNTPQKSSKSTSEDIAIGCSSLPHCGDNEPSSNTIEEGSRF